MKKRNEVAAPGCGGLEKGSMGVWEYGRKGEWENGGEGEGGVGERRTLNVELSTSDPQPET